MSTFLKRQFSTVCQAVLGRRNTARLGRFLYSEACLTAGCFPESLCDHVVQKAICDYARTQPPPFVVVDAGANIGEWSRSLSTALSAAGVVHRIHSIEPFPETFATLTRHVGEWKLDGIVRPFHGALSSEPGTKTFYSLGANIGQNSLHPITGSQATQSTVTCYTLDDLVAQLGEPKIGYLKIDTEGHDLEVIRGGMKSIASGHLSMLQFEYNHRWVVARHFLRDAFELLQPHGFRIGKITRSGIEFYDAWHPELESFHQANFLAVKGEPAKFFPTISWWLT